MCGIAGILGLRPIGEPSPLLKKMTAVLSHRGPDGDGVWANAEKTVGLGHRRLAIIDLSEDGRQPMHYLNERYTLTFNGEIYNYIELRRGLEAKGYTFKSSSDTEVLMALFHEKREKCLGDLDGMFAFAIWDDAEKTLFCTRDRFGEKPFYYAMQDGALLFASEMKALWAAGVRREHNNKLLFNYLTHGYVQDPHDSGATFFEGIRKLPAAHYFTVTLDDVRPRPVRYWDVDYRLVNNSVSDDEAAETFRRLFVESVSRRLRSDVPVGSSLSGGLDSSLVVCVIDELNRTKRLEQNTFSARFPGFARDEGKYMEMVINTTNVKPHFVFPDEAGFVEDLQKLFYHQEEPFGSASIYAQYCVMRLAKEQGITVLLDGQGADEILAGYHFYFEDFFRELRRTSDRRLEDEVSAHRTGGVNGQLSRGWPALAMAKEVLPKRVKNGIRSATYLIRNSVRPFLHKEFFSTYARYSYHHDATPAGTLGEALHRSTVRGGLEELLRYADRNSMAHSREVRLPFLSHELVEFVFSLPSEFKIRNGVTKYIMRQAFSDLIPEGILNRRDKIGYEPPQANWLKAPSVTEAISNSHQRLQSERILDPRFEFDGEAASENSVVAWKLLMAGMLIGE